MTDNSEAVLLAIRAAWNHGTDWEDFGREVGAILTASGLAFKPTPERADGDQ